MLVYTGIATVQGPPDFELPVYEGPEGAGAVLGAVQADGYVPHFRTTDDHAWLEVTLHTGDVGWMQNDPDHVTVVLPDPTRLRLCIDPGHGGTELGAVADGLAEKEINFDIAYQRLYPRLLADDRIERVWVTRNGDYDVSLRYRWDLANASFAALFVSVHANSSLDETVRGTEVYYKCGAESTAWLTASSRRAGCLTNQRLREQIEALGSPDCPWVDRGVICRLVSEEDRRSYYFVLQNANVPAILVETMYMSNPGEAVCLAQDDMRDRLAQALYDAINDTLFTDLPGDACQFETKVGL